MEITLNDLDTFTEDVGYVSKHMAETTDQNLYYQVLVFLNRVIGRHARGPINFKTLLAYHTDFDIFPPDIGERLFHISVKVELGRGVGVGFNGDVFYDDEYDELRDVLEDCITQMTTSP